METKEGELAMTPICDIVEQRDDVHDPGHGVHGSDGRLIELVPQDDVGTAAVRDAPTPGCVVIWREGGEEEVDAAEGGTDVGT